MASVGRHSTVHSPKHFPNYTTHQMVSPTPSHSTVVHPSGHQRYKTFPGIQSKFPLPYVIPLLLVLPLGPMQAALLPPSYLRTVHMCRLFSHGRPLPELGRFTPSHLCSQASRLQPLNHLCCSLHTPTRPMPFQQCQDPCPIRHRKA